MTDDRFERALDELRRSYNRPPETPRDEMWAAIEAARAQETGDSVISLDKTKYLVAAQVRSPSVHRHRGYRQLAALPFVVVVDPSDRHVEATPQSRLETRQRQPFFLER